MHNLLLSPIQKADLINELAAEIESRLYKIVKNQPPEAHPPTEYLTRQELKDLLKVDLSTIHNWTKKGKINAYGIGNRVYFKRSEVDAMLVKIN
jgi:excisionase family DNA binding protein